MVGKLFKFDFRTSIRQISIIWVAAIASSILLSIVAFVIDHFITPEHDAISVLLGSVSGLLYIAVIVALSVLTVIIVVMRFYKGVCDNEGYLLHTLPVTTRSIIISKGAVATAITAITAFVIMLSIFIIALGFDAGAVAEVLKALVQAIVEEPIGLIVLIEFAVLVIASIIKSVYQIYASIAIGQLAGKHRILLSLVAYIAIGSILSTIAVSVLVVAGLPQVDMMLYHMGLYLENHLSEWGFINLFMLGCFAITALQIAVFHFITEYLLTRKLNLL